MRMWACTICNSTSPLYSVRRSLADSGMQAKRGSCKSRGAPAVALSMCQHRGALMCSSCCRRLLCHRGGRARLRRPLQRQRAGRRWRSSAGRSASPTPSRSSQRRLSAYRCIPSASALLAHLASRTHCSCSSEHTGDVIRPLCEVGCKVHPFHLLSMGDCLIKRSHCEYCPANSCVSTRGFSQACQGCFMRAIRVQKW